MNIKFKNKDRLTPLLNYKKNNCHQLNNSKSKFMFSFTKNKRFSGKIKRNNYNIYNNSNFYKVKRYTTFGYGNKYDFTTNNKNFPGPNLYVIKSNLSNISYSFGVSRDKMLKTTNDNIPGPGKYNLLIKSNKKKGCTLSTKYKNISKSNNDNYKFYDMKSTLNSKGINFISKYKNSKAPKINPLKIKKFKITTKNDENKEKCKWPYYDIGNGVNKKGKFCNSKYINVRTSKFSKSKRGFYQGNNKTPGPGSYLLYSNFGNYVSSKFK